MMAVNNTFSLWNGILFSSLFTFYNLHDINSFKFCEKKILFQEENTPHKMNVGQKSV